MTLMKLPFKTCHYKKLSISTLLKKSKMVRIEMYNLQTRLVQFKDQKKLKMYSMVKIDLFLNENKLSGHKSK